MTYLIGTERNTRRNENGGLMIKNAALHEYLLKLNKSENKETIVHFVIPSGVIRGIFKEYDLDTSLITLSRSNVNSIGLGDLTFSAELIIAWGNRYPEKSGSAIL
jgi:hypothetical protein